MPKSLRVPVLVDREAYDEFKSYSLITGVPVAHVIREAMEDFRETSLRARLEALTLTGKTVSPKVIPIDIAVGAAAGQA